jgi:hypothetical protein
MTRVRLRQGLVPAQVDHLGARPAAADLRDEALVEVEAQVLDSPGAEVVEVEEAGTTADLHDAGSLGDEVGHGALPGGLVPPVEQAHHQDVERRIAVDQALRHVGRTTPSGPGPL